MNTSLPTRLLSCFALAFFPLLALEPLPVPRTSNYHHVVGQTAAMTNNPAAQRLAHKYGLNILNVTWEDTGRYKNSAVGPNISDMTIQVRHQRPGHDNPAFTCMPVIRFPNFSDKTADLSAYDFYVPVGNQTGSALTPIPLSHLLDNLREYLSEPESWAGDETSLLADRDDHVLVSAQACFLPIPQAAGATFNPVLFNYQSSAGNPAVLTILATREGTSVTVIDNQRDGFSTGRTWGQRLFFNQNGERASFTGQRLSDFKAGQAENPQDNHTSVHAAGEEGLNMVMLIQVPLKQKRKERSFFDALAPKMEMVPMERSKDGGASDVEAAVIGHGDLEGPFTEIDNLAIERDPKFPIRVTVQFYKATSNGVVSKQDMADIATQINRVYNQADYVGSLVTDGETGRPTEYAGNKKQPKDWWQRFWDRMRR